MPRKRQNARRRDPRPPLKITMFAGHAEAQQIKPWYSSFCEIPSGKPVLVAVGEWKEGER